MNNGGRQAAVRADVAKGHKHGRPVKARRGAVLGVRPLSYANFDPGIMNPITTTTDLEAFVDRARRERYVTIDTEFMRDRTYWPKLCLVQIATRTEAVAVDPLAPGIDLAPLHRLLRDLSVLKVFHACRQDLEIFYRMLGGELPEPVFDTQVAAMVLGLGEEASYESLVSRVARARLDKSSRFTDWSRRPLSEAQLRYALADVTHLRVIYERLHDRLAARGRLAWVDEELANLLDPALYEQPPEEAWKRLKLRSREPRFVKLVQELAAWRERIAQRRDLPRNRILRDDLLLELAANRPTGPEELRRLSRISLDRQSAAEVVAIVRRVMALPEEELPRLPPPPEKPRGLGPVVDLLRVLLKYCAEEYQVAQRLLAGAADLEAIAAGREAGVPALAGWRREIFGERALALRRGHIALTVRGRRLQLVVREPVG